MNKNFSYKWAWAVAVLFLVLQILFISLGFNLDTDVTFSDYLAFFISGLFVGAALIFLLRRCPTKSATRGTTIGFITAIPFALMGMFFGGPSGAFGTFLFSVSPTIFVLAIGYLIGLVRGRRR